jgi:NAD(P)-dependent dehydrogenase (short-subunit alcohol dehydrogenase family)
MLAMAGASIVATSRSADGLGLLQAEVGIADNGWLAWPADLTDDKAAKAVVAAALDRFGHLDILAAVAGGWRGGSTIAETDPLDLEWLLGINLVTAFNACRAVLPGMVAQKWGRIVTIGARAGLGGQARSGPYAASKAALLALTQSIAAETRSSGITANTVMVSTIDTPANRAAMPESDHHRWVTPEQIAATVCFLCSEEAAAISGAAIPVYGRG